MALACTAARRDTLDASPHAERIIAANGACLSLLDWGGRGPLLILMPGYGDSAHMFDDLAPAFVDRFHVVGLTPRGFPPSDTPPGGYTIAQLAEDVHSVMDSLGFQAAILVGHSMSGAVITQFGQAHAASLTAAVYLDASFDFGPAFARSRLPGRPTATDTTSAAYREWQGRYSDSLLSRSILNTVATQGRTLQVDQADAARRRMLVSALATEVRSWPHEPWRVVAPLLALCSVASFDRVLGWITPDSPQWEPAHTYYAHVRTECDTLARRAPNATVVDLDSGHYIYIDQRDAVVRTMRSFLASAAP